MKLPPNRALHLTRRAGRNGHSPTSATGTGWERTPRHAMQRAAREALRQISTVE